MSESFPYVFDEGKYIEEIKNAIDKTYESHYAQKKNWSKHLTSNRHLRYSQQNS